MPTSCNLNNLIDHDTNVPENVDASFTLSENNCNVERHGSFIVEEKVFNEWIESCKQSNFVVLNNKFFELLNLFTDSAPMAVNVCNGEPFNYSTNCEWNNQFKKESDVGDIEFKSQRVFEKLCENSEVKNLNYENGQLSRNSSYCVVDDDDDKDLKGTIMINDENSTGAIIVDDGMGDTDFEEFVKSQNVDINQHNITIRSIVCNCGLKSKTMDCKCYNKHCSERTDLENNALNVTLDLVSDDSYDDDSERNIDFNEMFKSQKADCYIEDYFINKIDEGVENVVKVDDDDVISISDSPEFFSGKLSKQITQQKLKDCFNTAIVSTTPEIKFIDLCSPSPPEFVEDKSTNVDMDAVADENNYSASCSGGNNDAVPSPRGGYEIDDDMDFMFVDYLDGDTDVFTQKEMAGESRRTASEVSSEQKETVSNDVEVSTRIQTSAALVHKPQSSCSGPNGRRISSPTTAKPCENSGSKTLKAVQTSTTSASRSYDNSSVPFNIMKACNLLKPGFSLKRSKATFTTTKTAVAVFEPAVRQVTGNDNVSPICFPKPRRKQTIFSQSTPKVPTDFSKAIKRTPQVPASAAKNGLNIFTSSSDDDNDDKVFINGNKVTGSCRPVPKKRRRNPKKVSFTRGNCPHPSTNLLTDQSYYISETRVH